GNGLLPGSMVAADPRQAYTLRDNTRNRMTLLSVNATRWLTSDALWSGIAYYRDSAKATRSGDVNQITDPRSSSSVTPYENGDPNASSTNRTNTDQRGYGFSTQLALTRGGESEKRN